ncbi:hypothetical protein CAPTEDRAFT_107850 [Capitella teleta]|uniref:Mannosyltransferase n=1 Tax=Capitella teleta TaxID=283909 RepID=R7UBH8_CAPTE|nr:hypothetical protein CAPTEDRAFT_107850 [Capitella teleta]|eukprot:ELU03730.1 hypothetical protein CAPTEDRAFT_107850 [Capitella teleta]
MSSEQTLFLGLLAFRVINALILQTSFVPDEYWQSIEVAHNMAFSYGAKTWEWRHGLRGYLYPLIFAIPYKILGILGLDNRIVLIKLPLLIQAVFAALADVYLYKLSSKLSGVRVGRWSLLCQLTSWFTFYCAPRTLTNSLETALTTIAMHHFPWPGYSRKAHWKYLVLVGVAVVIRPTAAIVWIPMVLWHLRMYFHCFWDVFRLYVEKGFLILAVSSIIDRYFYGKWVYVHLNFLEFNVFSGLGSFYGTHPWHWYLSQGLAVILGIQLFPFVLAVKNGLQPTFIKIIAWTVAVYSCLGHKEFRFIFPILPLAMHLSGLYLALLLDVSSWLPCSKSSFFVTILIAGNLPLALYTSLIHQRGTLDVMRFIYEESSRNASLSVVSLMPCHSTPHHGYLHRNISLRFLTCEPNLDLVANYTDESDVFYEDPVAWLNKTYATSSLPSHIVMFDVLLPRVSDFISRNSYEKCAEFFHSHFPRGSSWRLRSGLLFEGVEVVVEI